MLSVVDRELHSNLMYLAGLNFTCMYALRLPLLFRALCIVYGTDFTSSTVVLLLSVCTGCTGTVLAVSVYYYSSKNVYSIVYIILRLHSKFKTVLRFIDGTEYSTTWSLESRYGKWYHFSNPWFRLHYCTVV